MNYERYPGALWIRRNWALLEEQYGFQWVAATAERVVASDRSLERVIDSAIEQDLIERVVFAFVNVSGRRTG